MINVKFDNKDNIARFLVTGHAGYAKYGKDIVCAAVSTALIMTANLYEQINNGYNIIALEAKEGYFCLEVKTDNEVSLAISKNLADTLETLAKDYPKYIKYNG